MKLKPKFGKIAALSPELVDGLNRLGQMAHYIGVNTKLDRAQDATEQVNRALEELEDYLLKEYPNEKVRILQATIVGYMRGREGWTLSLRPHHGKKRRVVPSVVTSE